MNENHPETLSREELLLLVQAQHQQIQSLQAQLAQRRLAIEEAGSIAQAALQLSGVFQASQLAADQYLESVAALKERQEQDYCRHLEQAEQQARTLLQQTEEECRAMVSRAEKGAAYYWDALQLQLDEFFARRPDLVSSLCQPEGEPEADTHFGPDD